MKKGMEWEHIPCRGSENDLKYWGGGMQKERGWFSTRSGIREGTAAGISHDTGRGACVVGCHILLKVSTEFAGSGLWAKVVSAIVILVCIDYLASLC